MVWSYAAVAVGSTGGGPAWWQTLLIAIGGGAVTLVGTVVVGAFTRGSNRSSEWFRRVQWAQELTSSGEDAIRAAGFRVLDYLSRSRLADKDGQLLLEELSKYRALAQQESDGVGNVDDREYVWEHGDEGGEAR